MAGNVSRPAVALTTDNSGLSTGLQSAGKEIKSFAKSAESTITSVGSKAGAGMSSGLTAAVGKAGPWGAAIATVASVAGAGLGAFSAALQDAYKSFGKFNDISKAAKSIGVGVEEYQGLVAVFRKAGLEADQVGAVVAKLGKKIEEAAMSGDKQGVFSSIGLEAAKLANMRPDEQIRAVSDAIAKLPPGSQQAAAALKLFEEQGIKLLPALQGGAAGIDAIVAKQKSLGGIFSKEEVEMAAAAKKAWGGATSSLEALWENFKQRALISLAPIIETGGKLIGKIVDKLLPLVPVAQQVFSAVAEVAVPLFEEIYEFGAGIIESVSGWISSIFTFGEATMSVRDVVIPLLNGFGVGFAYLWDVIKVGAGAASVTFGTIIEGLSDVVIAFQEQIRNLIRTVKSLPTAVTGLAGVALKFFDENKLVQYGVAAKQFGKDMQDWGKKQADTFGNSAQKVDDWFANLEKRKKKGLAMPEPRPDRQFGKEGEWEDLMKKPGKDNYVATAALEKGSQGALSAINRFDFERGDYERKSLDEFRAIGKSSKEMADNLKKIAANWNSDVWD